MRVHNDIKQDLCEVHHGNISVQKLPQICTQHIVKRGKSGVDLKKKIKSGNFSIKLYVMAIY